MTVARAFPYLRYDPDVVGDPGRLLAPPYDVVSAAEREQLVADAPYQSARIELPERGDNRAAGELFRSWIEEGVLEAGEVGLAVIQQRYIGPDGVRRKRIAAACEVKLSEFHEGEVLPHERTMNAPRGQRLELMGEAAANISPVFMLFHDEMKSLHDLFSSVTDEPPDFTSADADGTQTAVWFVTDTAVCELFEAAVRPHPLLIADGHHRYEAALAYRELVRSGGSKLKVVAGTDHVGPPHTDSSGVDGVLAVVANSADPGMSVFPTHRVVRGVDRDLVDAFVVGSGAFDVTEHAGVDEAMQALAALERPGFVMLTTSGAQLFALADESDLALAIPDSSDAYRSLDVVALHALILDGGAVLTTHGARIDYTRSLAEAREQVDVGDGAIAFLLRAVDVAAVHEIARDGGIMPQKSTYFYPKVPTGVVFRQLDT